mmetsp:Transcript_18981/g.35233  ORF Transcript_18981/g.35233 Transcript_18981/m.35233 type:complete len:213 (+) Transcript_18981:1106-1744(+)
MLKRLDLEVRYFPVHCCCVETQELKLDVLLEHRELEVIHGYCTLHVIKRLLVTLDFGLETTTLRRLQLLRRNLLVPFLAVSSVLEGLLPFAVAIFLELSQNVLVAFHVLLLVLLPFFRPLKLELFVLHREQRDEGLYLHTEVLERSLDLRRQPLCVPLHEGAREGSGFDRFIMGVPDGLNHEREGPLQGGFATVKESLALVDHFEGLRESIT